MGKRETERVGRGPEGEQGERGGGEKDRWGEGDRGEGEGDIGGQGEREEERG